MKKVALRLKTSVVAVTLAATAASIGGVVVVNNAIAASHVVVVTSDVNLRSGPGMEFDVLRLLPEGTTLTVAAAEGPWSKVTVEGQSGYVWGAYTSSNAGAAAVTAPGTRPGTAITTSDVNVRSGPSSEYAVVDHVEAGTAVRTTGAVSGNWTQIVWDGVNRWMYTAYLNGQGVPLAPATATVGQVRTTSEVNLRLDGNLGPVMGQLPANSLVDVTGETTPLFTQVLYKGQLLWLYSDYVAVVTSSPVALAATGAASSGTQATLVDYVKAEVGKTYKFGGDGPSSYDNSGLTMAAYRQVGVSLPHHVANQATLGIPVLKTDLQPGDLLFFNAPASHVALYIGNGQMVHARNTDAGIVQQSVQSYIDSGAFYAGARRVLS